MKREELKDILQNSYSQEKWIKTLQFLSGSKNLLTISLEPKFVEIKSAKAKEIVVDVVQLGTLKTTDGITLPIFDVTLQDGIKIEYNRVGVNDLLKNHILKDAIKGAIVTFHYGEKYNKPEWRFSFISKFGSDYFAEAESIETNPKKYTYIFGTSEEHRTALERLYNLEQSRFRLEDFFEAFNVEPVSKKFFDDYKKFYQDFVEELSKKDSSNRAIFEKEGISTEELEKDIRNFVKRLLGRLVFLYFLQKKHWLGATNKNYDDGDTNFLFNLFNYNNESKDQFYNKWLSKLFFNALNTANRTNDRFELPNGNSVWIPFLNGGLFEEHQEPERHREIQFPPTLFELLFKFFNGYNFTIYENSPEDHTVAVDPEMLGNIFENLLEDNKDKGAFYTPKEIVHYMTQESLIEYLKTHLSHSSEAIENLIKNHITTDFTRDDLKEVEKLIDKVKICDPAIGSGAFPMGLLQEIFALKALIHYEMGYTVWSPAKIKQDIIQNSIYGVDIEEGAVDIARLRFWLSLVVDEPSPKPLPNLDYKIMQGNSLLESFEGVDLSNVDLFNSPTEQHITLFEEPKENYGFADDIKQLIDDYFNPKNYEIKQQIHKEIDKKVTDFIDICLEGYENRLLIEFAGANHTLKRKKELKQKTDSIQKEIENLESQLTNKSEARNKLVEFELKQERPYFLWHLFFADVFDNGGFDIIIGNPPYIQIQKMLGSSFDNSILNYTTYSKSGDIYCLFYEKAGMLLKKQGVLSYITSNSWIKTKYGKSLRNYFTSKLNPTKLLNFEDTQIFPSATVEVNILLAKKEEWAGDLSVAVFDNKYIKKQSISNYFENNNFKLVELSDEGWIILNNSDQIIKTLIFKNAIPLKELKVEIRIGIINGFNDAFIINSKQRQEIINNCENCKEIIKPLLLGKNLSKFHYEWDDKWLINTHNGIKKINLSRVLVEEDYFEIYKHLLQYKNNLEIRQNKGDHWTNLRNCGYFLEFEQPKILWGELSDKPKFVYDNKGMYADATLFSMTGKNLLELVAILNSKVALWFFNSITTTSGMGTNRWKKYKIEQLPIPINHKNEVLRTLVNIVQFMLSTKININDIVKNEHIANFFEEVIDGCVFELYFEEHMKEKDINIIDDVKKYIDESDLNQNFEYIEEKIKMQKIWELYKTMSTGIVQVKMTDFITKSPDILKPILQS
jgi:adenine-specific DNA-methyltransferase